MVSGTKTTVLTISCPAPPWKKICSNRKVITQETHLGKYKQINKSCKRTFCTFWDELINYNFALVLQKEQTVACQPFTSLTCCLLKGVSACISVRQDLCKKLAVRTEGTDGQFTRCFTACVNCILDFWMTSK